MKTTYNRQALKLEFFQSDIDEIKVFLESKYGQWKRNWTWNKNTRGWSKEKQEYKDKILEKALEKKAKEEAKNLEISTTQLKQAKKTVIWLLMKKLKQAIDSDMINVKEQERILKMIKTELWEPTNISKNDTTLKTEPLDESLFIQD